MIVSRGFYMFTLLLMACADEVVNQPIKYPEEGSSAARLMLEKCSTCHAAPKPDIHTANIWPSVVFRMQLRMKARGFKPLVDIERETIVDYLQHNAGQKEEK